MGKFSMISIFLLSISISFNKTLFELEITNVELFKFF